MRGSTDANLRCAACGTTILDVPEASKIVLDCYAAATEQTVRRILDDLRKVAETCPDEISPGLGLAIGRIGAWEWYPQKPRPAK